MSSDDDGDDGSNAAPGESRIIHGCLSPCKSNAASWQGTDILIYAIRFRDMHITRLTHPYQFITLQLLGSYLRASNTAWGGDHY